MKSKQQSTNITNSMAANKKASKAKLWVCFIAYLLLLAYVVFISSGLGRVDQGEYRYNLTLFHEIGRYYSVGARTGNWMLFRFNVIGNILVFMPLGVFLPKLFQRCRKLSAVTLLSLEVSLVIEVTQLATRIGSFDVDDLLLNTMGGILGYLIYRIVSGVRRLFGKGR